MSSAQLYYNVLDFSSHHPLFLLTISWYFMSSAPLYYNVLEFSSHHPLFLLTIS
jgi:hypothetical protein